MKYPISFSLDLRRNPYKGKYYAFEGIDGSGKSTQIEKIKKHLEKLGQKVTLTSEPQQEGAIQEIIRNTLFEKVKIPSRAYQNLYSADRVINHENIVEPALKRGEIVLTHRSIWSTPAYGILDLGEEYDFSKLFPVLVSQGNLSYYHQFLCPDKTFYLRVTAKHAVERLGHMEKKKDIYENAQKLAKIVTGYNRLAEKFPDEITVIDGEKSEEEVTRQIINSLNF